MNTISIKSKFLFILGFIVCIFFISCSKDEDHIPKIDNFLRKAINYDTRNSKEIMENISPELVDYYNNIKSILYATNSIDLSKNQLRSTLLEEENPMVEKLKSIVIEDENTGKRIGFYDLPLDQRRVFLDLLLSKEAESLMIKCESVNGLKFFINEENKITKTLLDSEGLRRLSVGSDENLRSIKPMRSIQDFLAKREKGISNILNSKEKREELRGVGWIIEGGYVPKHAFIGDKVVNRWIGSARRGDFVLALPLFEDPSVDFNKNNEWGKVGHAGIICNPVNYRTQEDYNITLEAYPSNEEENRKDGVHWYTPADWRTYHYVMGICSVVYKWKWRGFKSGIYKEYIPVEDHKAMAKLALTFEGRPYAGGLDFVRAKSVAPDKFICTTLVWYCAKITYDINVSGWYASLVSVTGLFTDDCTYIRKKVF